MEFLLENIKKDVEELSEKEFLIKYLLKSNNWYFSEYQNQSEHHAIQQMNIHFDKNVKTCYSGY